MAANRLQMNPAKTELLCAGSIHNISMLGSQAPVLQLGSDTVTASDHVRVLGVTFSSDLTLRQSCLVSRSMSPRHVQSATCTAVFTVRHLGTSPTISSHPPTSLLGSAYVPQTDISSSYRAVDSTHTAVGRFRSLVRWSGTRCLTKSEIRRVVLTVLSSFLRQSCLVFTNVKSALEVFTHDSIYAIARICHANSVCK